MLDRYFEFLVSHIRENINEWVEDTFYPYYDTNEYPHKFNFVEYLPYAGDWIANNNLEIYVKIDDTFILCNISQPALSRG